MKLNNKPIPGAQPCLIAALFRTALRITIWYQARPPATGASPDKATPPPGLAHGRGRAPRSTP